MTSDEIAVARLRAATRDRAMRAVVVEAEDVRAALAALVDAEAERDEAVRAAVAAERARCAAACCEVAARYRRGACSCEECEGRGDGARECAEAIERDARKSLDIQPFAE